MALEMRAACEHCDAPLAPDGAAAMNRVCPNCGGELVARPRRKAEA